jgi:hypothetical protein
MYIPTPARIAFDMIVATGAPAIPILKLKIKMGSSIVFTIILIALNIVGVSVLPCELIIALMQKNINVKGISKKVNLKKISLKYASSPLAPIKFIIIGLTKYPTKEKQIALTTEITISCVAYCDALSYFDAPTNCAKIDVPAINNPIPTEMNRNITGHTKDIAANCIEPSLLTQIPSIKLYSV